MTSCSDTEKRGIELAMQLIGNSVYPGSPIIDTNAAKNRIHWQRQIGDYILQHRNGQWLGIDVKTEGRYTGNLFVESWSNKSGYRSRDGWIFTLGSDWLFMVYLDVQAVFLVDLPKLKNWCVIEAGMLNYPEKTVHRFTDGDQKNRTTGHPIPWTVLIEPLGVRCFQHVDGVWLSCTLPDTAQRGL